MPNGQTITVTPVFSGLFFKANDYTTHHSSFPPGWTIVLQSGDDLDDDQESPRTNLPSQTSAAMTEHHLEPKKHHMHRYKLPTLRNDSLFISSISNPSSTDFKPPISPTRQIAMMLWATLWWYFHQPQPDTRLRTDRSAKTADAGKPKGDWRINIRREGIFKGRHLLQKLERMGLIASEESSVGVESDDRGGEGWTEMFVSRRSFWQIDARIFIFTLSPTLNSPYPSSSPYPSRPGSPNREGASVSKHELQAEAVTQGLWSPSSTSGPFSSGSHLPTYYPPPPLQYTFTNNVRHPIRPKPPRQGETFYTRYIPSLGQYLSFRVPSLSDRPPTHTGPVSHVNNTGPGPSSGTLESKLLLMGCSKGNSCDKELLHTWMNDERVAHFWGEDGPQSHQENFLRTALQSRHSFPAIGCWDGIPFGYFEIYWVKEDHLGTHLGVEQGDWDRGFHCLIGEQDFRGAHRVKVWLSALVHYCWLADMRTNCVMLEPRIDNQKLIDYLHEAGFHKEKEISFPHKHSALMKVRREAWEAPAA
ncbi:MAG: hypothetical protein M1812_004912 [Candelaria pacifica]|nr:MAG: hypothetical protein M1812_004912 [Candelaria pacifica]